jgi:DNA-binding response OmpR family regulator
MVQDIISEHAGFILVQSEPGVGTTFEILLPVAVGEIAPEPAEEIRERVRGKGERILVLDDEPSITMVAEQALEHAGYTPETFNSSTEAWVQFTAAPERYELLLIDFQMPELTGVELAIRVRHATATLPIIIMTARTGDLDLMKLQELGGVSVLPKPFDIHELIARVNTALQGHSTRETAATTIMQ